MSKKNQVKFSKDSHLLIQAIKECIGSEEGFNSLCEEAIAEICEVNSEREWPLCISWSYSPDDVDYFISTINVEGKYRYWHCKKDCLFQYFDEVVPLMIGNWVIQGSKYYPQNYVETIYSPKDRENALVGAVLHRLLKSRFKRDEELLLDGDIRNAFEDVHDVIRIILTLWVWGPNRCEVQCDERMYLINFRKKTFNCSGKNIVMYRGGIVRDLSDRSNQELDIISCYQSQDQDYDHDEREI